MLWGGCVLDRVELGSNIRRNSPLLSPSGVDSSQRKRFQRASHWYAHDGLVGLELDVDRCPSRFCAFVNKILNCALIYDMYLKGKSIIFPSFTTETSLIYGKPKLSSF